MNPWASALLTIGIPMLLFLYLKGRIETPKAGLIAVAVYILLGLTMISLGWDISPWVIVIPGLFVALLNVSQLWQTAR
ncbi:MAG: hypothetical protein J7K48_04230 [Thermococcus sp.]|uniref:Permease n=1 Tax=Thermococcus guaymasensis DSM 11113 TaxID=1432656 RepID=A0A0X1KNF9_9EURY|nr:hypothetical protein [Thermococcus guaymasensis]AJC72831.1 hypothetical protein X802_10330 [Thermococcus guaymasensis DSM 11113]MCD6524189.1 hypothetical protein [Thermococcus sp.]